MIKLCNFSNLDYDLARFDHDGEALQQFLADHRIDGLEMLLYGDWNPELIPPSLIHGVHLLYWPMWLAFCQGKRKEVLDYFGTEEALVKCYEGTKPEIIIEKYRQQICQAEKMGAEYMVFHINDGDLTHIFDRQFTYTDKEVVDGCIALLNEIMQPLDCGILLLMENLWLTGLTFLKPHLVDRLLSGIAYPHKGFMLDTGHLLNTNTALREEEDGVAYILQVLERLGENRRYIKGMHLQKSLSGAFVSNLAPQTIAHGKTMAFLMEIDQHRPFETRAVQKLVDFVQPDYLTYEFITRTKEQWSQYIQTQNLALQL